MSTTQLYFNLLPSDLCAASNFRHAFIFLTSIELIFSCASAGLSLTLSIAIITQQKFIRFHTSFHPFFQASIFLIFGIILIFKVIVLAGLGLAILLNDGEIFVTCAQEEIDELMKTDDFKFFNFHQKPIMRNQTRSVFGQGLLVSDQMVPGPFTCGADQNCLYRAATALAVKEAGYASKGENHLIAIELCGSEAQTPYINPTEVARKCFRRRQACLHRLRHIMAVYPILQLILGAASIAFWFSSDDIHPDQEDNSFYLSQLPSLRLFNSYLILWAVGLIHLMVFLLIATWHYARVDWQMQVLAVQHVLKTSRQNSGRNTKGSGGNSEDHEDQSDHFKYEKIQRCPSCRKRERDRKDRQKDQIRDSYSLRKAVKKEEKILAKQERKMEHLERTSSTPYLVNAFNAPNRKQSWDDVHEHRVAALSSLLRNSSTNPASILESDYLKSLSLEKVLTKEQIRRSLPPKSMPVSPSAMSSISSEDAGPVESETVKVLGSGGTFGKRKSTLSPNGSVRTSFPAHTFSLEDFQGSQSYERDPTAIMNAPLAISRPCSVIVAPSDNRQEIRCKRAKVKSILQSDYRPISTRKQKHVTFPARFENSLNGVQASTSSNMNPTPLPPPPAYSSTSSHSSKGTFGTHM